MIGGTMSVNPYDPPRTQELDPGALEAASPHELSWFSPKQIGWATFFGTPMAGSLMMRENARVAHDQQGADLALWTGVGGTVLLFSLAFVVPDNFPNSVLPVTSALAAHSWAKLRWARRAESHRAPRTEPSGRAVKITLLTLLAVLAVALTVGFAGVMLFPDAAIWQE